MAAVIGLSTADLLGTGFSLSSSSSSPSDSAAPLPSARLPLQSQASPLRLNVILIADFKYSLPIKSSKASAHIGTCSFPATFFFICLQPVIKLTNHCRRNHKRLVKVHNGLAELVLIDQKREAKTSRTALFKHRCRCRCIILVIFGVVFLLVIFPLSVFLLFLGLFRSMLERSAAVDLKLEMAIVHQGLFVTSSLPLSFSGYVSLHFIRNPV
jgi:hypothetical protein